MAAPRVVVTVGLHGSASTCVFNVARELMIAAVGEANVAATFADDMAELPPPLHAETRHLVLKTHRGSPSWRWLVALTAAPVLLSVRDPRDSVASVMERFGMSLEVATQHLADDCELALFCKEAGAEALRFEDRFYDDATFAARVAARLGLCVPEDQCLAIAGRYSMQSTRAFTATLDGMPAGRVYRNEKFCLDTVTQIHRTHIGDARCGKWRDHFQGSDGERLTERFLPFMKEFGYAE